MIGSPLWKRTAVDFATLSAALLDVQKQHSRVTHDRDDALIATYLGMALGIVERRANINLVASTFESVGLIANRVIPWGSCCWYPGLGAWGYLLPFNNVVEVRVLDAAAVEIDVSTWSVVQEQFGGNADAYFCAPTPTQHALPSDAATMQIDVGVATQADLDPAVLSVVLRIAGSIYEYREANLALIDATFAGEISTVWRASV